MAEYECWFCAGAIERSDAGAILITIGNLWRYDACSMRAGDPVQNIYAHEACAKDRLRGATIELEPQLFSEGD